jgi:hypothetical protein
VASATAARLCQQVAEPCQASFHTAAFSQTVISPINMDIHFVDMAPKIFCRDGIVIVEMFRHG